MRIQLVKSGLFLVLALAASLPSAAEERTSCQITPPTTDRAVVGEWGPSRPFGYSAQDAIVAIHAHLLPDGRVLAFERNDDKLATKAMIWTPTPNPEKDCFKPLAIPGVNVFCSGHAFLPDGKLLIAGGHHVNSAHGTDTLFLFDWRHDSFTRMDKMNAARWYPSALTLRSGDVLVLGGSIDDTKRNEVPQVWQTAKSSWRSLTRDPFPAAGCPYYYPMTFLAPDGKVFVAGPHWNAYYLDAEGSGARTEVATSYHGNREAGSAVQYAPGKILLIGGGGEHCGGKKGELPKAAAETIDLNQPSPAWREVCPMRYRRRQMNATILPDGKVLAVGGTSAASFNSAVGAELAAEMWDPDKNEWTTMAAMKEVRLYHSISLLLPDGSVLVAGGGQPPGGGNPPGSSKADQDHRTMEVYRPPYFFKGPRPTLGPVPEQVAFGAVFTVKTPDAASIKEVSWLRLGSVTHAFDESQTFQKFSARAKGDELTVTAPTTKTAAPGPYLLFALNGLGVPSIGKVVFIR